MSGPRVSTIIPAYRAAHTIRRAVDSLLAQTRPPDEVLVIDDGSPDDLAGALRPYGERLTLLRQPNGGAGSARNRGLERARGDLLALLDADDAWEPHKLERQLQVLGQYPEVGLIACHRYEQRPGQPRKELSLLTPWFFDRVVRAPGRDAFAVARRIVTSSVVVRREILGDRRFDRELTTAEDFDLWVRLVAASPVYLLSEPLITYTLEPGSLSRSDLDGDAANMLRVVRRHAGLLGRRGVRSWEADTFRICAAGHLALRRPRAALGPAWRRLWRQPWSAEAWWIACKSAAWACGQAAEGRVARRSRPASHPLPEGADNR